MKWKDFRAWMNEYFNDEDDIRITVTNEYKELNRDIKDIYPVITIITPEESEDDGGYPIFVASDLEEREEGYYAWSHADITDFTNHGNIEFEQTNPVISDFIQQQSREQTNYKYIVQIIPDYNSSAIKDDWRDYKECLCYEGAEKCVKEIVDDPRQHKAKRVRIVVEYIDSSLERYIKDHTDNKGNLKPKSVTLSPEHIGKKNNLCRM